MKYLCKKELSLYGQEEHRKCGGSRVVDIIYAVQGNEYDIEVAEVSMRFSIGHSQRKASLHDEKLQRMYAFKNEQHATHLLFPEQLEEHFKKVVL